MTLSGSTPRTSATGPGPSRWTARSSVTASGRAYGSPSTPARSARRAPRPVVRPGGGPPRGRTTCAGRSRACAAISCGNIAPRAGSTSRACDAGPSSPVGATDGASPVHHARSSPGNRAIGVVRSALAPEPPPRDLAPERPRVEPRLGIVAHARGQDLSSWPRGRSPACRPCGRARVPRAASRRVARAPRRQGREQVLLHVVAARLERRDVEDRCVVLDGGPLPQETVYRRPEGGEGLARARRRSDQHVPTGRDRRPRADLRRRRRAEGGLEPGADGRVERGPGHGESVSADGEAEARRAPTRGPPAARPRARGVAALRAGQLRSASLSSAPSNGHTRSRARR